MTIHLVITGEPVAQGRPRFSTQGGRPRAYDPAKSRDYNWDECVSSDFTKHWTPKKEAQYE